MRAEQIADDRFTNYCCVCGKTIKVTGDPTKDLRLATCSTLCHQLFVFCQGLVCGHVLGSLLGHYDFYKRQHTSENSTDKDGTKALDKLMNVKPEPNIFDSQGKCDADTATNVLEELLQVTFHHDYDANQACDVTDDTDSHTYHDTVCLDLESSASSSPTTQKLPSTYTPNTILRQDIAQHKESNLSSSVWVGSECVGPEQSENNVCKVKLPVTKISKKMTNAGFFKQCNGAQVDLSVSPEENGATGSCKKKVTCDICGEKFVETHLNVHKKAKHIGKLTKKENCSMISCTECNKMFDKRSLLNKHLAKKHPRCQKLSKTCSICHKGFLNQIGLSVHMRHVHKTDSPKECDLCQRTFKSSKELSRHKLQDHKLRVHICHLCGKNFAYGHALKSHLDAHAGVKKHFCEVCGEGFVRMTSLCGHRITAHSKKDDIVHTCEVCKSHYATKSLLNKHLFEAHFTGPYAVKNYSNQKCVTQDQNCQKCQNADDCLGKCPLHNDSKQYICSHCGKNFSKAHYLKAHEKQHQEAKFSCDICCKRFTYKCNLKTHRSTHSSDKPFQCTVCSKQFRLKFLLDDHQRTHNRDLLFKCYVCGRGLTRIPNLKRHIRIMHPEVSYERFTSNLQEHG